MLENKIETADFGVIGMMPQSRIDIACESASAFHDREYVRLTNEREKLRERLLVNPAEFDDIQEKLRRNRIEIDTLERSWKTSSLNQRYIMTRTQRAEAGLPVKHFSACERRISAMPSSDMFLTDESRPSDIAGQKILAGYAAKYNRLSLDLGGFKEKIQVGAFNKVIKTADCRCLFNHDANHILGRTPKTLRLFTDTIGLGFFTDLIPNDTLSNYLIPHVQRGDISGCSFCFVTGKDSWQFAKKTDETDVRTILEISELLDVSPCTYPAYPSTIVGLREKPQKPVDMGRCNFEDFQNEEDDEIIESFRRSRQAKETLAALDRALVERQYKHAGRIINQCRAKLE